MHLTVVAEPPCVVHGRDVARVDKVCPVRLAPLDERRLVHDAHRVEDRVAVRVGQVAHLASHVPGGAARERARRSERAGRRVGAASRTDVRREDGRARWTREISSAGRRGAVEPARVGEREERASCGRAESRGSAGSRENRTRDPAPSTRRITRACERWPRLALGLSWIAGGPHSRAHPTESPSTAISRENPSRDLSNRRIIEPSNHYRVAGKRQLTCAPPNACADTDTGAV